MRMTGIFLVGGDFDENGNGVLIVGVKRENQTMEVINAFRGEEAYALFQKISENRYQKALDKVADEIKTPIDDVPTRLTISVEDVKQG